MHIFITGIAGFLGANLADYYISKKFKVSGCDNLVGGTTKNINLKKVKFYKANCENLDEMTKIMKGVDVVVHTAAYPHEGLSSFSPYLICKSNFIGAVSVFTAATQKKVKRIVFCSSMARYGSVKFPFSENQNVKPVDPSILTSDKPPILVEITGTCAAIASNATNPKLSFSDGRINKSAMANILGISFDLPKNFTSSQ